MSYYVYGSSLSWSDYLQAKSFVDDISSSSHEAGHRVSMEISRQTREVIASNEALARENIRMMEANTDRITSGLAGIDSTLNAGFDRISYDLQDISSGISELNASFHWGFSQLIAGIGHMNDALSELIKIAKTPVQTVAFNHFEIARDAFRKGLLQESLEELDRAIKGDHSSPGYKLEWRFHQMVGIIRLGFAECELSLVDLKHAEESFLLAARYAKTDYPEDAARAFLSAGWTAYCQGKMKEALAHTEQALALHPKLGEALFQAAKVRMALGEVDKALPVLAKAIELDRLFALKAAGDGDFQKHDDQLREFLEALRQEKYRQGVPRVHETLEKIKFWREHSPNAKKNTDLRRIEAFVTDGVTWPLLDMLAVVQTMDATIAAIQAKVKTEIIIVSSLVPGATFTEQEKNQEKETYREEVEIKPGGLFHRPVTEMQTKTRVVTKTSTVERSIGVMRDDICYGSGKLITNIDFCKIPADHFMMGIKGSQRQVSINKDFYIGKYPVTQAQWQAVMGNNPSHFKGDPNVPVDSVSWNDCQDFLNKLNGWASSKLYRLPTEAEWEYACRAGSTGDYCFGDEIERTAREISTLDEKIKLLEVVIERAGKVLLGNKVKTAVEELRTRFEITTLVAGGSKTEATMLLREAKSLKEVLQKEACEVREYGWYDANSGGKTQSVGKLKPNAWGLYDMHGNLWEWCEDWYDSSKKQRVMRGGSWCNGAGSMLCALRGRSEPAHRGRDIGFRCLRDEC